MYGRGGTERQGKSESPNNGEKLDVWQCRDAKNPPDTIRCLD